MTTLLLGISMPSFSASKTIRLAMRSLTDPPAEKNSVFPTKLKCSFQLTCREGPDAQRLHLSPSAAASLSKRIRGVLPMASRALSRMVLVTGNISIVEKAKTKPSVGAERRSGSYSQT